jgi:propionyl-CoA carboxylase alpha chain
MFKKILIANRGEIACRVIKSARRMGIATVAVYSEADRNALHVEMADEAVAIGAAPAAESYLVIDRILEACKQTGAEAVHPGYGFLSENSAFPKALAKSGIVFIGPPPKAIEAMGDKIESKTFAEKAGVNTVPGHMGIIADADEAVKIAGEIGYPVMIKASAGGGGKGMRIAWNEAEAREGFQLAGSEARSSFGDDRIFIEKFIEDPRHIEIQVLADGHGNAVHLFERECSIQRRNQKVIEEAPSPFLDAQTRAAMGAQSVALAKAVGYQSAGTVEFIVDKARKFYFLEMNTRLQVEHPVTELITGVDLVEQMIRVAAGEPLAIAQDDLAIAGWAIESRIYAEDPYRNFLPSIGRLTRYRPPAEGQPDNSADVTVRNDTGVFEGAEISRFYDPMVAKLCTHAPTRAEAIDAMSEALDGFLVEGIRHNVPFLSALMAHPRWQAGDLTTAFIAEEYPDGFTGAVASDGDIEVLALVAGAIELVERSRLDRLSGRLRPHSGSMRKDWVIALDERKLPLRLKDGQLGVPFDAVLCVGEGEETRVCSDWKPGEPLWHGTVGGRAVIAQIGRPGHRLNVARRGVTVEARLLTERAAQIDELMPVKEPPDTSKYLLCPMPGMVVSIAVAEGQKVEAGEALATVEAMKMENVLRAERDCVVASVQVGPGDSLAVDEVIMEFE